MRWQTEFVEKSGRIIWSAGSNTSEDRKGLKEAAITWWQLMAKLSVDQRYIFLKWNSFFFPRSSSGRSTLGRSEIDNF